MAILPVSHPPPTNTPILKTNPSDVDDEAFLQYLSRCGAALSEPKSPTFIIVFPSFSSLYLLPVLWCESFLVVIVGIPVFFGTVRETMHLFFYSSM